MSDSKKNAFYALLLVLAILGYVQVKTMQDLNTARTEIAELETQLQQEQEQHDTDVRQLNAVISEKETQIATYYDEVISLKEEIRVLQETHCIPDEVLNLTDSDKQALLKVAMAESENQGVIGKALVMRVVLNRVKHPTKYVDNAEAVILSGAFSVTEPGGRYYTCKPDWECEVALYLVEHGWDGSKGACFFNNSGYSPYGDPDIAFQYKGHYFN